MPLFDNRTRITRLTLAAAKYISATFEPVRPKPSPAPKLVPAPKPEAPKGDAEESCIMHQEVLFPEEYDSGERYSRGGRDGAETTVCPSREYEELFDLIKDLDKTFVDKLLDHIKAKGLRDAQVYRAASIDRRLFSKIVSNRSYSPSKDTAIAFALALHLKPDEASDLLATAGYTLSHSVKRDVAIEYFFREKIYSLTDVNEILYSLGLKTIGR